MWVAIRVVMWAGMWAAVIADPAGRWARTTLKNQGYEGVVVGISPLIPESQADQLIPAIKAAMTQASEALFTATRRRLYFSDIKILVPLTWTNTTIDEPATTQRFEDSEVRVDLINPVYVNQPYTVQPGRCGDPGRYIHLTPDYLISDNLATPWGPRGKVVAGEWGRLRWGVFDELGYPEDPLFPLFYFRIEGQEITVQPNHCSDTHIKGRYVDINTHGPCSYVNLLPDDNCRFVPDSEQTATSSLMSFTYLDSVEHFCDTREYLKVHQHDPLAPTRQNLLCEGRSAWEVMRRHSDFTSTTKLPANQSVTPTFTLVREEEAKFTLVLDHSGSMLDYDRMGKMQRAAKTWILHDVASGSSVAIINFGSTAVQRRNMTKITGEISRRVLAAALDTENLGGTCIGCGLQMAVQQTEGLNNKVIMLITDGMENVPPYISGVMDEVVESGSRVVSIAYGLAGEQQLEELARKTGGKAYFVSDDDDGSMLDDAFEGSLTYQPGDSLVNTTVKLYEYEHDVSNETELNDTFTVDPSVGRNLEVRMETKNPSAVSNPPYLISPDGQVYSATAFDSSSDLWIIKVDMAEAGKWSWAVGLSGAATKSHFQVTATAKTRDPEVMPIYTESWMNVGLEDVDASTQHVVVYARVTQGDKPVVGATVRAYVTTPDTTDAPVELELLDNGQGADVQAGDGVYSRYFTQYTSLGRYSVKTQVWDEGSAFVNNGFLASRLHHRTSLLLSPATSTRFTYLAPSALTLLADRKEMGIPTHCCGSVVPYDPHLATPTGEFTRTATAGSFKVVKLPEKGDSFPPIRVLDLRATGITEHRLTLHWTAPGEDLDQGTVSCYDVRMSQNREDLLEDTFAVSENNTVLLNCTESENITSILVQGGRLVSLTIDVDLDKYQLYYVALTAMDSASNISPVSNLAPVMVEVGGGGNKVHDHLPGWAIALIVLGTVAVVGTVVALLVVEYVKKQQNTY